MKTNQSFVRGFVSIVGRTVGFFFGRMSWSAPPWLAWSGRCLRGLFRSAGSHPWAFSATVLLVALLASGGWQSWLWWESHRPRKFSYQTVREVSASISAPDAVAPGALDKDLKPLPMLIRFEGAPVAPLDQIGKDAADAVTLEPSVPGKWSWQDGSTLRFEPDSHWAPGLKLQARLKPEVLAKDIHLKKETLEITTPPLMAKSRSKPPRLPGCARSTGSPARRFSDPPPQKALFPGSPLRALTNCGSSTTMDAPATPPQ